jgi:hypothetical protein
VSLFFASLAKSLSFWGNLFKESNFDVANSLYCLPIIDLIFIISFPWLILYNIALLSLGLQATKFGY